MGGPETEAVEPGRPTNPVYSSAFAPPETLR